MIPIAKIEFHLMHALTEHDLAEQEKAIKIKSRGHYNPYALGIYCASINEWRNDPLTKTAPFESLARYFTTCHDNGIDFSIKKLDKAVKGIQTGKLI